MNRFAPALAMVTVLLGACAAPMLPPEAPPRPQTTPDGTEPAVPDAPVLRPEDLRQQPAATDNAAVTTLLARADQLAQAGDSEAALAAAERAQRMAPRDPRVYLKLGELRLARYEYGQAEQLALKGLSLGPDPALGAALEYLLQRARGG